MVKKNKKKKTISSDYGPAERQQHGLYIEIETPVAGVKALRNITIDPIETYKNRGSISESQYIAADNFAGQYRRALLAATYTQVRYNNMPGGGEIPLEAAEAIQLAKQRVRAALEHVGHPLADVVEHVCGECFTAGSWKGVATSNRPNQDGMVALRLGLDGLVQFYKVG
jgi:hypothetical protein